MIVAVDFDGTCVTHEYPNVGKHIGAVPVLKWLVEQGHQIILWTMRGGNPTDQSDDLQDAIAWFTDNGIQLCGINSNPTQGTWTSSPKAYAQIYIDDAALGCPLTFDSKVSDRSFVDWVRVKVMLQKIFDGDSLVGYTTLTLKEG